MVLVKDLKKEKFLIDIENFLALNLDKIFERLLRDIEVGINKVLRKNVVYIANELKGLKGNVTKELKEINRTKIQDSLKLTNYFNSQENTYLFSLLKDLISISKSLKELQVELNVSLSVFVEDEQIVRKLLFESGSGKEVNLIISSLEDNINKLNNFLK